MVQASFLGTGLLVSPLAVSPVFANEAADLDQCANDPAPSSPANGCSGAAGENGWVNGNLNASKSVFLEGDSIPYRIKLTDLTPSTSNSVTIEWDTTKSSKHAIDYITDWNESVLNANPCLGVSGCSLGSFDAFPIPGDPQVTGAGVTPVAGSLALFGGTIDSVSSYFYSDGTGFSGDKTAGITINFTPDVANPVLAWGGHIASRQDWGQNNSAVAITGSPYHTRLLELNGSGGNQDRSLKEDAVIFPGSITIIKQATPEGSTSFGFTAGPAPLSNFNLVDNGTSANTQVFSAITSFTTYTVTETLPSGWQLDGRACQTTSQNGGSTSNSGASGISINLKEGENVTCTFTNSEIPNPSLNVTKTATSVDGDSSAPFLVDEAGDVITYSIVVQNTGNVTLHNVSVSDPLLANEDCDGVAGAPFVHTGFAIAVGGSLTCTGSYTVSQADIDNNGGGDGDIDNVATADSDETGPDTDDETVPLQQSANLDVTKSAAEANVDSAGDLIHYTITVFNTGNVTLTGVSIDDPLLSDEDCDGVAGAPFVKTGFTILAGGSLTCTGTYAVTQADIDNNGGGDGDIDNTVTADSNETPSDTASEDVPIVRNPALNITKTATSVDGDNSAPFLVDEASDLITYQIVVANTGNVTLHNVSVSDTLLTNLDCDAGTAGNQTTGFTLAVGASLTCAGSYTVSQGDIDNNGGGDGDIDNIATADSDETGPDTDDETVPLQQDAGLNIVKDASVPGGTANVAGEVISYTITVQNTGNQTLTNVIVSDPFISNLTRIADVVGNNDNLLEVGDTWAFTATHTVTQAELDSDGGGDGLIDNTATADSDQTGPDDDDADVPIEQNPSLIITKTATSVDGDNSAPFLVDAAGDVITYSIVVQNTGNVTLTNVDVSDSLLSNLDCSAAPGIQSTDFTIAVGGSLSCSGTYTVTQADIDNNGGGDGDIDNVATADSDETGPKTDDETVPLSPAPSLEVTKVAAEASFSAVNQVIHYTITVKNTGNTTLTNVVVTDGMVTDLDCDGVAGAPLDNTIDSIAVGAEVDCTASHIIVQADLDAGHFYNLACADDGQGGADSDCDDEDTPGSQNPALSIDKVDETGGFDSVGDVIDYSIVAENTGNVTLHGVVITDEQVDEALVCTPSLPVADLVPGGEIHCTAFHTITQEDLDAGSFFNEACVDDTEGPAAEICDDVTTDGDQNPELSIMKFDDDERFDSVGDVIDYVIVATNTGNVTLHGVVVTDAQVDNLICLPATPVADLEQGEQIICSASHTITQEDLDAGSYFNEACVDDTEGPAAEDCDDVTTDGEQNPELSIDKVATEAGFDEVGDVIHYSIVAENTGNVTLHDVVVTDAQVSDLDCTPDTPVDLAPGEKITCTASHTVVEADFDDLLVFNQACVDDENGEEETGAAPKCDDVSTPGQELQQETDVPSQPPTDGELGGGSGRPVDGAWLLVIGLAILLGAVVLMTPNRRRSRR